MQTKKNLETYQWDFWKADYSAKVSEIEAKMPSISCLAADSALTAVENKIPDTSNLVRKIDYGTKTSDTENKYITTADYNKLLQKMLLLIA